jgi:nitroreductase
MNVIEAMHSRRSIRAYRPQAVERATIEELVWDAAQAPTPPQSGDTPWAFVVIEGAERIDALGVRAKQYACEHQPPGHPWSWADRPDFRVFWGAPVLVLICARNGNPETMFDCCRAGQNLVLAAHARGLGSCWVGAPMPWLRSPGVAEELQLPAGFEPAVAMLLGHPAEQPAGTPKPRPRIVWWQASDPA